MKVVFTCKEITELKKVSSIIKEIIEELDLSDDLDTNEFQLKDGTWVSIERFNDGSMSIDLDSDLMGELLSFASDLAEASRPLWMAVKGLCTMIAKKVAKLTSKVEALCEYGVVEADLKDFGLTPAQEKHPSYFFAVVERKKGSDMWTGVRDTERAAVAKDERVFVDKRDREVLAFANKNAVIVPVCTSHKEAYDLMNDLVKKSR